MNRIRIGLLITAILGMIFASAGLFDSLTHVAIGLIVSGVAVLLYGLVEYVEARRDDELARGRAEVWARRDSYWATGPHRYTCDCHDQGYTCDCHAKAV